MNLRKLLATGIFGALVGTFVFADPGGGGGEKAYLFCPELGETTFNCRDSYPFLYCCETNYTTAGVRHWGEVISEKLRRCAPSSIDYQCKEIDTWYCKAEVRMLNSGTNADCNNPFMYFTANCRWTHSICPPPPP